MLTEPVLAIIVHSFRAGRQQDVIDRLADYQKTLRKSCGDQPCDELIHRVTLAILKNGGSDPGRFGKALALAATDWRDALVEAGFADSIDAHKAWEKDMLVRIQNRKDNV